MITLKNLSLRRGSKLLLDQVCVSINPGESIGLVGRNGAGKSTLLALLTRQLHEDAGDLFIPPQWRMAQVEQTMPETAEPATDFVLRGDSRLTELRAALEKAQADGDGMAIAHAYGDLTDAGEHDARPRAQALILGLGFKLAELDQPVNSFSGGWRMRLQLARALMSPSDLLLLDEPTNHLDLDALVWLEAWLKRYTGTLIVISHDREFLDAITEVTLHIDNARITRYGGNYSRFEELRTQQLELQQASWAKQQDRIAHLQKFIDRFKAKASKARQAQSRVKALERMEKIAPMLASADFSFGFKEPGQLPNPMLAIADAAFGYTGQERTANTVLRHVNRSVLAGQRIGILGANGQGKSTLVKTIARAMKPLAGQITEGKGLVIGYFAQQELDLLRPADDPLAHMLRLAKDIGPGSREPAREQDLRNHLGRFNFSGDMVRQTVGTMSGGEKARLVLAMIVWQRPNLLLLDEPTNHLDLATREALTMALNEFEGTVLLVSHDRALLRAVCDEFWLVGRGVVAPFDGDLDDYQRYLLDEAKRLREQARLAPETSVRAEATAAPIAAPATRHTEPAATRHTAAAATQRKLDAQARQQLADKTRPLNQQLQQIDQRLALLSTERSALEQKLNQALPATEIAACGRRLKAANAETARLEERWLEISAALEEISGATVNGP
ncbi:ABC-F family ATP-binding cassette domain-containing protein [Verminephrobacter eiseniae]|uniref:ABC-F family ATP-binding cassette domain-containing protein n=1 Tax=Verminephrobacter eiseniae TaxID=364317 RepID=UPI002237EDEA|nr:ATP-binding cassette domain-containing protein [Verminephrobacter eiseniae]MCW5295345.1 ATP-binding cassette domain-containing protein [Verminephrobacter eiseniae]MCW8183617.1 ATP-binding cassette domain-containing protein [Verminephrobacter eiseniae]MCW8223377.1 ATP-binding cassette domain-containing protein [Verminephrobacter eiseniae]MCW8233400.1 ATP-binding cassette domain-containing protein [Verminephrobacter eiseniae]